MEPSGLIRSALVRVRVRVKEEGGRGGEGGRREGVNCVCPVMIMRRYFYYYYYYYHPSPIHMEGLNPLHMRNLFQMSSIGRVKTPNNQYHV